MKKSLCVIASLIIAFLIFVPAVSGAGTVENGPYPTIMVAGYSSSNLYLQTENGPQKIWGVDTDEILRQVLENIARIGRGLGELAFGHPEYISDVVGGAILEMYGDLSYAPDGRSVYDILPYSQEPITKMYDVALTQHKYLNDYLSGDNIHEKEISQSLADLYGEGGDEYVYSFQTDFRQNIIDIASDLDRFIDAVREYTGKDKVNIFAVSHGGEIVSVYLSLYGTEKNAVNNAVLTVPSIGGAALAYDVMSENVVLDEETLLYFIENGNMVEADINWLVRANQFGILDDVCNILVRKYVKQLLGYWGSMWDFIPAEYYEELKERFLDSESNAAIIEKSDIYHYEILPSMSENLSACVDAGMNVYIVAGSDLPSVTGLQEQSDAIITVNSSTGAQTSPYGKRFNDGYNTLNTVCRDSSHNHLSPAMTVDASTAYLPEYTWLINGLYHGMTWKDPYAKSLCCTLISSKERVDVYSYAQYPQFKFAENNSYSVLARFNNSREGYLDSDDSSLIIKNLSGKYTMRVISVSCDGAEIDFDLTKLTYIEPGKEKEVLFKGSIPEVSLTTADVTVTYVLIGNITPVGSKTYTFTLNNGPAPEYDFSDPFTASQRDSFFDGAVTQTSKNILSKTGALDWFKMIVNSFVSIIKMLRAFCALGQV